MTDPITPTLLEEVDEEQQENKINKANAKAVFSPEFIPVDPSLLKHGLTLIEAYIYGFIKFYTTNASDNFYFTNEQLAELTQTSERTVSRALAMLEKRGLIKTHRRVRAGGGQVRFVKIGEFRLDKLASQTRQNVPTNNNKINNNNLINNDTTKIAFGDTETATTSSTPPVLNLRPLKGKKLASKTTLANAIVESERVNEANEWLAFFNQVRGARFKSTSSWFANFCLWRETYSLEEMKEAVTLASRDDFFDKALDPDFLFRTRNKNGNCDYIGKILSLKPRSKSIEDEFAAMGVEVK